MNAVCYAEYVHLYEGFFKSEQSKGIAVDQLLERVGDRDPVTSDIRLLLSFIGEICKRITSTLTSLEETSQPLVCSVQHYRFVENISH